MNLQNRLSVERNNLGEVLPLIQPYVLLVDPSNICNLRCKWCPSGWDNLIKNSGRNQQFMGMDLFARIVDQAKEYDEPFKVLRLYKEGEPLINPDFPEMVQLAKRSGKFLKIDTTTNGIALNNDLNRKIINAGIDQINISVNGINEEQIYKNTGRRVNYEEYKNNIIDLCKNKGKTTVYIKSIKDILNEKEQGQFLDMFGEYADRIFLERLSPAWPGFDVNKSGYKYEDVGNYGQNIEERQVCPYLFYIMVVNSDGTVSTCVGDWKHEQIVGSVKLNTLKEIWLGERQKEIQVQHLQKNKKAFPMCKDCLVIKYGCYDNIDNYSEAILNMMNK